MNYRDISLPYGVFSQGNSLEFHRYLLSQLQSPRDLAYGISLAAFYNVSGGILRKSSEMGHTLSQKILSDVDRGLYWLATGITEPEFGGNLKNLQSSFEKKEGAYFLNFHKNFVTNGVGAKVYLVLCKDNLSPSLEFLVFLVEHNAPDLSVEEFSLSFLKELSHCKLSATNLRLSEDRALPISYRTLAEELRTQELYSMHLAFLKTCLLCLEEKLSQLEKSDWDSLEISGLLEVQRIWELLLEGEMASLSQDDVLKKTYPFGTKTLWITWKREWERAFSQDFLKEYPDFQLFELSDRFMTHLIQKSKRKTQKHHQPSS